MRRIANAHTTTGPGRGHRNAELGTLGVGIRVTRLVRQNPFWHGGNKGRPHDDTDPFQHLASGLPASDGSGQGVKPMVHQTLLFARADGTGHFQLDAGMSALSCLNRAARTWRQKRRGFAPMDWVPVCHLARPSPPHSHILRRVGRNDTPTAAQQRHPEPGTPPEAPHQDTVGRRDSRGYP